MTGTARRAMLLLAALGVVLTGCETGSSESAGRPQQPSATPEEPTATPNRTNAEPQVLPVRDGPVILPERTGRGRMELPRFNAGDYADRYTIDITCKGGGKAEVITRQVGGPPPPRGATEYDPAAVCDGRLTTIEVISRGGPQDVTIDAPHNITYSVALTLGGSAAD